MRRGGWGWGSEEVRSSSSSKKWRRPEGSSWSVRREQGMIFGRDDHPSPPPPPSGPSVFFRNFPKCRTEGYTSYFYFSYKTECVVSPQHPSFTCTSDLGLEPKNPQWDKRKDRHTDWNEVSDVGGGVDTLVRPVRSLEHRFYYFGYECGV